MKKILIDGSKINTEYDFHNKISSLLNFGKYYGENLDALWDCLSCNVERPVLIIWENSVYSSKQLGDTYDKIITIFEKIKKQDIDLGLIERFDFIIR